MKKYIYLVFFALIAFSSCKEKENTINTKTENTAIEEPVVNFNELVADYMTWWSYHYNKVNLALDFVPINENLEVITKEKFLEALTTGNYITIQLKPDAKLIKYKLYKLDESINQSIVATIKNTSATTLKHYKMEGTMFPEFNVTDIKGAKHSNASIKGKTMVLKTWFIACKPCVAEFPELNELVETYKDRDDVIFTSLALDTKAELETFFTKKPFAYNTVAEQHDFIKKQLKLQAYPTHVVVNDKGIIVKVVNRVSQLITFINNNETLSNNSI